MAFWSRQDKLEDRLRAERPRPSDDLISSIKGDLADAKRAPRRGLRPQLRLAGITAALFAGLLVIGGAGYAMTSIGGFIDSVSTHIGIRTTVRTIVLNAANDNYGTTTAVTTTTPTPPPTPPPPPPDVFPPGAMAVATLSVNTPTSVAVTSESNAITEVHFPAFPTRVKVSVDPGPLATSTATKFQGPSAQSIVSIVVTDPSTGQPIHQLPAPMEIVFTDAPADYVPGLSESGADFTPLKLILNGGTSLPSGWHDGYYRVGNDVHIVTDHLTSFAVLYKANFAQSESGRKTATAGSGKFGDPTRIHAGAPVFDVPVAPTASGQDVSFSFFVDEQVALYAHVLSGGKNLTLGSSSTFRGHKVGGKSRNTLHVVILRPGLIKAKLHVPGLKPGAKVQLVAVDYDGHKVAKTVTIK